MRSGAVALVVRHPAGAGEARAARARARRRRASRCTPASTRRRCSTTIARDLGLGPPDGRLRPVAPPPGPPPDRRGGRRGRRRARATSRPTSSSSRATPTPRSPARSPRPALGLPARPRRGRAARVRPRRCPRSATASSSTISPTCCARPTETARAHLLDRGVRRRHASSSPATPSSTPCAPRGPIPPTHRGRARPPRRRPPTRFVLATFHRQENVDDPDRLARHRRPARGDPAARSC